MNIKYELIPEHMRQGTKLYIENGITPGSFLFFLLADEKWSDVLAMADSVNSASMYQWRQFVSGIPMACWGSRENVQRWMDHGGYNGLAEGTWQTQTPRD